jgi:type I restriction enzyme S subunit
MNKRHLVPLGRFIAARLHSLDPSQFLSEKFILYSIPAYEFQQPETLIGSEIGSAKQQVQSGDVLLSRIVPHIRRVWIVDEKYRSSRIIASGEWVVFRGEIDPYYLRFILLSDDFHRQFMRTVTGVGGSLLRARQSDIEKIHIPFPIISEQKRIVRVLAEAEKMKQLRVQSNNRAVDLIPALFNKMFGDVTEIDKMMWESKPLKTFAQVSYGLADKLDSETKPKDGTRILTISNVVLNGTIDTKTEKYSIASEKERAKARLKKYDLLFNWRNGSEKHVGKTAIWEEQISGEVLHVSFLLKIRLNETANPYFYWCLLNMMRSTGFFIRNSRMQINRKYNATELSELELPFPPKILQDEFSTRVQEYRLFLSEQSTSEEKLESLFQSLLHQAFEGDL